MDKEGWREKRGKADGLHKNAVLLQPPLPQTQSSALLLPLKRPRLRLHSRSCGDRERVEDAVGLLVDALEPALVADLQLEDPQLAAADGGVDELVAAALVAIGCDEAKAASREKVVSSNESRYQLNWRQMSSREE